ncbi:hypothetical protein [Streptomyces sp. NPDC050528]|uniref:hypothetical protein n=1 Tax=unclassified Streptomyces TaxID=2593676 RepID=UPI00379BB0E6
MTIETFAAGVTITENNVVSEIEGPPDGVLRRLRQLFADLGEEFPGFPLIWLREYTIVEKSGGETETAVTDECAGFRQGGFRIVQRFG